MWAKAQLSPTLISYNSAMSACGSEEGWPQALALLDQLASGLLLRNSN